MNCPHCHHTISKNDTYCTYCGKPVPKHVYFSFKKVCFLVLLVCVGLFASFSYRSLGSYPSGMYAMYDETGKTICTLSLQNDGKYVFDDKQDYSMYKDNEEPAIVLHHNFKITESGLTWKPEIKGKCDKTDSEYTYMLKDVLGGLFEESEDAYMVYTSNNVYLYSVKDTLGVCYRFVRIS